MSEFKLSEKRKEYYNQLFIDLQEGNLTLRQIVEDFIEVNNDLDKEFIKKLKGKIEITKEFVNKSLRNVNDTAKLHIIDKLNWIITDIDNLSGDLK